MTAKLYIYLVGFALSLLLTFVPVGLLWLYTDTLGNLMYVVFVACAVLQLFVQVVFFLHVGEERRPRYRVMALAFSLMVVCIVVGGTLWIMHNLSHGQALQVPFIKGDITPQASND